MQPLLPELIIPPGMFNTQDCRLDQASADVCEAIAEPYIVSHIMTGYIGHGPGPANQVLVAAGQDETTGGTDDAECDIAGSGCNEPV
jgi:hypothetical protein